MTVDLASSSILVAGATGGLGSAITSRLLDAGADLTLLTSTEDHLSRLPDGPTTLALDLRRPEAAEIAVQAALDAHGRLDAVVCAIGAVAFGPAESVDLDTLEELLLTNLIAPIRLAQAAIPHLGEGGTLVNLSAIVAETPTRGMAAYSATKAALTAFDVALATEVHRRGIRVLDVRPPHTETGLADRPLTGDAPRLPQGLAPDAVADRIVAALADGTGDLPASAFTD